MSAEGFILIPYLLFDLLAEETPDFVILSKPTLALKQKYRDSAGRVDISWLFDSISNYRLLPADDYRV